MENQMKRGLLDVCVLASIKNEDSYGYQIVKDMSPYVEISESTLYPPSGPLSITEDFGSITTSLMKECKDFWHSKRSGRNSCRFTS